MRFLFISLLLVQFGFSAGQIGDPAADFTLSDVPGQSYSLSDYRDKVVILFFAGWS